MKNQIMSKLQRFEPNKLDISQALRLDQINRSKENLYQQNELKKTCQRSFNEASVKALQKVKKFFLNFNNETIIKHQKVEHQLINPKRKLEPILSPMVPKHVEPTSCETTPFLIPQPSPKETVQYKTLFTEENTSRPNYYVSLKPKDRVRKITSLVNLRKEQSMDRPTSKQHRPGFIHRKNNSLTRKQSSLSIVQDQNRDPNCNPILRRMSKQKQLEPVDKQIQESKDRIARIRKQLNEIYLLRKPNSFRLKLF